MTETKENFFTQDVRWNFEYNWGTYGRLVGSKIYFPLASGRLYPKHGDIVRVNGLKYLVLGSLKMHDAWRLDVERIPEPEFFREVY